MHIRKWSALALSALACAVVAQAQSQTSGAIRGGVKAKQKGAVAGAKLILRNIESGLTRTGVTDANGNYSFLYLPLGDYEVTVTADGLRTAKSTRLHVTLGETTFQNFDMDKAEATATVVIEETVAAVDTTQINTASSITPDLVEAVPIQGRNFTDLVQLTPGASTGGTGTSYRTTVEGARGIFNSLQVDGTSYNNKFNAEQRGGTRVPFSFSQDSIRELQVITNPFDAQYGDASGAVVNAVTKSGTNEFHGMGMILFRPSGMLADVKPVPYDPYGTVNTPKGLKRDFRQRQFAFNVGGPIIKDKLHFFVSAEYVNWRQLNQPTTTLSESATADEESAYNQYWGVGGMGRAIVASPDGYTLYEESSRGWYNDLKNLTAFARLDWTVSTNHRLVLRVNTQNYKADNDTWNRSVRNDRAWSNNSHMDITNTSVVLELTSTIGSNMVNEARIQRATEDRPVTPNSTVSSQVAAGGFTAGQSSNDPRNTKESLLQIVDNLSWMGTDWTFKGGVDAQIIDIENSYLANRNGAWYFRNLGAANAWYSGNYTGVTSPQIEYSQNLSAFNGQVKFREKLLAGYMQAQYAALFNRRLNLSLGLRYTREMWEENPLTNAKLQGLDHMPDNGSLDPRFGFTLDLFGNNKTVIRGGYGFFSSSNPGQNAATFMTNNGQNTLPYKLTYANQPTFFTVVNGVPGDLHPNNRIVNGHLVPLAASWFAANASTGSLQVMIADPDARMAQAKVATLGVEQDMGSGLVLAARVTFKRFMHMQYWMDINMGQYAPGGTAVDPSAYFNDGYKYNNNKFSTVTRNRPGIAIVRGRQLDLDGFGQVFLSRYDGEGRYKALILEANRRVENGFGFKASLTLAKAEDTNSNERSSATNADGNPTNPAQPLIMGRSDNDQSFRAIFTGYLPPYWGIKVSGTATYSSGFPYTPRWYNDYNGDGVYNETVGFLGGRNGQRQPNRKTFDLRISRNWRITRGFSIETQVDVYNVFNWANQTTSGYVYDKSDGSLNPAFGQINVNDDRTRELQFTIKARF